MAKNVNIIGIHFGHNAAAALLKNGAITLAINEERLNRIKNSTGFPSLSLAYIKERLREDIDYYVFSQHDSFGYNFFKKHGFRSIPFTVGSSPSEQRTLPIKTDLLLRYAPNFFYAHRLRRIQSDTERVRKDSRNAEEMRDYFSRLLCVSREKILYADHHRTHALSTKFFEKNPDIKTLAFTLDGEGDGLSATVRVFENDTESVLSRVDKTYSLGYLYRAVTMYLGMKPDEHEFKVMGLAPYAKKDHVQKLLPLFEKILWLNDRDEFQSHIPMQAIDLYLKENLVYHRFDTIAGAIQECTEQLVTDWISRWVKKTGIRKIAIAGGVFMNVKLNQKIAALPEIEMCTVVPSAGDETTAFGACLFGYHAYRRDRGESQEITPIRTLCLGTEYDVTAIQQYLEQQNVFARHTVTKPDSIETAVATLLADNNVVARFADRMEFGARALGNRSILAHPSQFETVRIINEMIKNRDFWMPFAASILEESAERYLVNSKKIDAPYMAITFNTTPTAQKELAAAIHPHDKTCRPQIVRPDTNRDYYKIISEFKKLTGIGGILNTSFNLHGQPNVESPKDALFTFENSGLKYLAMGPYLITKKEREGQE